MVQLHQASLPNARRLQLGAGSDREAKAGSQGRHQARPEGYGREPTSPAVGTIAAKMADGTIDDTAPQPADVLRTDDAGPNNPRVPDIVTNRMSAGPMIKAGNGAQLGAQSQPSALQDRAPASARHEKSVPQGHFRATFIANGPFINRQAPAPPHALAVYGKPVSTVDRPSSGKPGAEEPVSCSNDWAVKSVSRPADQLSRDHTLRADTQRFSTSFSDAVNPREPVDPERPATDRNVQLRKPADPGRNGQVDLAASTTSSPVGHPFRTTLPGYLLTALEGFAFIRRSRRDRVKSEELDVSSGEGRPLNADIYPVRAVTYRRRCKRPDGCVMKAGDTSFCDRCITTDF